jgi:hypothetical protein
MVSFHALSAEKALLPVTLFVAAGAAVVHHNALAVQTAMDQYIREVAKEKAHLEAELKVTAMQLSAAQRSPSSRVGQKTRLTPSNGGGRLEDRQRERGPVSDDWDTSDVWNRLMEKRSPENEAEITRLNGVIFDLTQRLRELELKRANAEREPVTAESETQQVFQEAVRRLPITSGADGLDTEDGKSDADMIQQIEMILDRVRSMHDRVQNERVGGSVPSTPRYASTAAAAANGSL